MDNAPGCENNYLLELYQYLYINNYKNNLQYIFNDFTVQDHAPGY